MFLQKKTNNMKQVKIIYLFVNTLKGYFYEIKKFVGAQNLNFFYKFIF